MKFPDAILEQHISVLGKTGAGKTATAKLLVEQVTAAGSRVCILDPIKSDWWGLTSSVDGKRPGLPFHILGGPRGHVPLHSSAGRAIGELVAGGELKHSIIDMADFEPGGQARFFVDFAPALMRRMRGVVYLVLEEAHLFAPKERSGVGAENMSIHWAKMLATAGRSKGIRLVLVSQRVQALHNALLGSCDTLIAHRLTAPADQEPILKWLKGNTSASVQEMVSAQLASLKTGAGWICSGEAKMFERVQFPRIATYDNSATPTDDDHRHEVTTAPVDPDRLRAAIGEAVKEAEANDPKLLRARIAELERGSKSGHVSTDPASLERAEQRGYARGRAELVAAMEAAARRISAANAAISTASTELATVQLTLHAPAAGSSSAALTAQGITRPQPWPVPTGRRPRAAPEPRPRESGGALTIGERNVLTAIAQHRDGVTREQLTVLTGYKRSTRDTYLQKLSAAGFAAPIDYGRIAATATGIKVLGAGFTPLPTGERLRQHWIERLPGGERRIFQILIEAYPSAIEREQLDQETGLSRSSRDTYLQKLKARQLVRDVGPGKVSATEVLFA